jgi:hypothetical protein
MALTIGGGITIGGAISVQLEFPPGAPTIGTATATGTTTATVAFTAPVYTGSSTITSYTATSSPGNITGTLNQAGSGTINITGLTASTSYTFTVTATNSVGTSVASLASNSITTTSSVPTVIGQSYGGGYYAGQISTAGNGVADYYLIVGPVASAQNASGLQWKTSMTSTPGTNSVIDGPTNTNNMNNVSHPAAYFCKGLTVGGYTDWYLPARNELEICYYNLKPTTATNNTNFGVNLNAVPSRSSNYTSGTPAQTTATNFKDTGTEDFIATAYWSSSQHISLPPDAWCEYFVNGDQFGIKIYAYAVRAVRRVAI